MGVVGLAAFWVMALALSVAGAGRLVWPLNRAGDEENVYAVAIKGMKRAVRPALRVAAVSAVVFAVAVAVDAVT